MKASTVARIVELSGLPTVGQVIIQTWFGRATVGLVEADGSTCTVAFDDGRCRLLADQTELTPAQIAIMTSIKTLKVRGMRDEVIATDLILHGVALLQLMRTSAEIVRDGPFGKLS